MDDYEGIFIRLFNNQAKKALNLHRLVCLPSIDLLTVLSIDKSIAHDLKGDKYYGSLYKWLNKELLDG